MTAAPSLRIRIVAAVALLAGGAVHLKVWADGYKDIDKIGPAFLANVVASVVVAVALILWRHPLALVAGLLVADGSLLAFTLSRTSSGFLDFTENGWTPSPYAALALIVELVAAVACLAGLAVEVLGVGGSSRADTPRPAGGHSQ